MLKSQNQRHTLNVSGLCPLGGQGFIVQLVIGRSSLDADGADEPVIGVVRFGREGAWSEQRKEVWDPLFISAFQAYEMNKKIMLIKCIYDFSPFCVSTGYLSGMLLSVLHVCSFKF